MQVFVNPPSTQAGDYVVLLPRQDDHDPHVYADGEPIALLCWTGFVVWSERDNLIPVESDPARLERLFSLGRNRTGSQTIVF